MKISIICCFAVVGQGKNRRRRYFVYHNISGMICDEKQDNCGVIVQKLIDRFYLTHHDLTRKIYTIEWS